MKKVLVACGTGIATSTMAAKKLEAALAARGLDKEVKISQCKVSELPYRADEFDLIIVTSRVAQEINTPIVQGLPFLTGVGIDKTVDEVVEKLGL
jgi:PTS system galactitol-specific IIB component